MLKRKIAALIIPALLLFLLCGCSSVGIGSKNILRAVYLEKSSDGYTVGFVCYKSTPSADASQAEGSAVILWGNGSTVFEALQDADHSVPEELLYSLNEILLIGPKLAQSGLFEAADFLNQQQTGRPSTLVYLVDLTPEAVREQQESIGQILDSIEQISSQNSFACNLYQLAGRNGTLIPSLKIEEGSTVQNGCVLYAKENRAAQWNSNQTQLAAILTGQTHRARFTMKTGVQTGFLVDSAHIAYEPALDPQGPKLQITLNGHIREIQTEQGAETYENMQQYEKEINRWAQQQVNQMLAQTFEQGNDIWGLTARLAQIHAGETADQLRRGTLYCPNRVHFKSCLEVI